MERAIKTYEATGIHPEKGKIKIEVKSNGTPEQVTTELRATGLKRVKVRIITDEEIRQCNSEYYNKVLPDFRLRLREITSIMEMLTELTNYDPVYIQALIDSEKHGDLKKLGPIADLPLVKNATELGLASLQCLLDIRPRLEQCRDESLALLDKTFAARNHGQ